MKKVLFLYFILTSQLAYSQYTLTRGLPVALISGTGTSVTLGDDNYSGALPIGFSFSFYGNSYTNFYLCSNGYISFGQGYNDSYVSIPSTSTPNNIIAFAAADQNCGIGTPSINYFTSGVSPNRILVVNFNNVQQYGSASNITTVQTLIYEGSNKIEIHSVLNKSNGSARTIGLENSTGTQGTTNAGLNNNTSIVANNEMIRFLPCTPSPISISASSTTYCNTPVVLSLINCNGSITWDNGSTGTTLSVTPSSSSTYLASCNENGCTSSATSQLINVAFPSGGSTITGNSYICAGGRDLLYAALMQVTDTLQWFKNGVPVPNQISAQYMADDVGTYFLQNKRFGCTINSNSIAVNLTTSKTPRPILKGLDSPWVCKGERVEFEVSGGGSLTKFVNDIVNFESTYTGADLNVIINNDSKLYVISTESGKCDSDTSNNYNLKIVSATVSILNETCGNRMEIMTTPSNAPVSSYQWYTTPNNTAILAATEKVFYAGSGYYSGRAFLANGCSLSVGPASGSTTGKKPYIYAYKYDSLGSTFKTRTQLNFNSIRRIVKAIKLQNGDDLTIGTSSNINNYYLERLNSSGTVVWTKAINASTSSSGTACNDVLENTDGTIVIAGRSESNIANNKTQNSRGNLDYWIVKISSTGTILWDKTIGGSKDDVVTSISLSTDGGLLIAGTSDSPISGDKTQSTNAVGSSSNSVDVWIVKLDQAGNKIFDKVIGAGTESKQTSSVKVIQNPDESYLIVSATNQNIGAYKSSNSYGSYDIWALKTSNSFVKIWDTSIGGQGNEIPKETIIKPNGDILILGKSDSAPSGNKTSNNFGQNDIFLVSLNSNGQILWDKSYGGANGEVPIALHQIKNSGSSYIVAESSSQASQTKNARNRYNSGSLVWILQVDQSGNLINDTHIEDVNDLNIPRYPRASTIDNQNELHVFSAYSSSFGRFMTIINDNRILPATLNYKLVAYNCTAPLWSNGMTTTEITPTTFGTYTVNCGSCISNPLIYGAACSSVLTLVSPTDNINNQTVTYSASSINGKITATNVISGSSFNVKYQSKAIELLPGFSTNGTGVFTAQVGGCN